jgi:hypothetical protein
MKKDRHFLKGMGKSQQNMTEKKKPRVKIELNVLDQSSPGLGNLSLDRRDSCPFQIGEDRDGSSSQSLSGKPSLVPDKK